MQHPTIAGIENALPLVHAHMPPTPMVRSDILSKALGCEIWLKNETVTPIASFKLRGALACLSRAHARGALSGAVTASTGNHGQGVAYAARLLGATADIFLPAKANPVKAAMIEAFGGTLHKVGHDIDVAKDAARQHARAKNLLFVDDGDDLDLMEGAGTCGLEIAAALPHVDCVIVPVGGANFISGVATAVKGKVKGARILGVQAKGSASLHDSFHAKRKLERPIESIADGLTQRVAPELAFQVMCKLADDMMLVSDEELLAGIHTMAEQAHVLVEPAGAAALCGAVARRDELRGKRVVVILSGANLTMDLVRRALDTKPLLSLGHG
jgi:threonine dehydratase